jgi:CO/xanthine dehydrogenase Mo-binding subunit
MAADAPIIHEDLTMTELGDDTGEGGNVADHLQHKLGDTDKGFEEADVIVEREFNTSTVHQGYIEPHSCTAHWNKDGRIEVWNSCQGPFNIRDATAQVLDVGLSQVKLTPMEIGGGFGGKFEPYGEPVAALLSQKTGRPVKMVMTRQEELEGTGPTPGSYIKVKMGATREGKIVAGQAHLAFEAGCAPGSAVGAAADCVFAPYDIPNVLVDGYDVVVNKTKTAAYRAPGATNAEFASETVVDELAEKLGIDPIELRLMNAAREGTRKADGTRYSRIGLVEVLEAMKAHPHYSTPLEGPNRARGVAVGFWMNAGLQSAANIAVNEDGTIGLTEGSPDIGGSRASLAMQAAEVLGIPAEDVHPTVVDTDNVGWTFGTGGSRTTFATGWAVYEAAQDVKRQMVERAALIWGVDAGSIGMSKGVIQSKTDTELKMSFKELAAQINQTGGPITGRGAVDPKGVGVAFAGLIADIEADPDTGRVEILRATVVQDAGKAIHPSYVEGQLQGGTAQGIGWALNEEYFMDANGRMANSTLLDYRMPISLDLPMIDTVIVEVANPGHPFGVRGVGEVSIVPPPAALANALHGALGVRMNVLPMNPRAIMDAVWKESE